MAGRNGKGAKGISGVKEVGKDTYQITISLGNDGSGKYKRKWKTVKAKNKGELEAAKAQFLYEVTNGLTDNRENMLFRDLVEDWKKKHVPDLSPRTWEGYESNLRLRILPAFGTARIGKLKKYHVMDFFDKLKQPECEFAGATYHNLSPATIKNHLTCMKSIFTFAVDREYIRESPMKGVKTPEVKHIKPDIYEDKDLAKLFQTLQDESLQKQALVLLTFATGAREGELAGLDRKYINLDSGYIIIAQAAICVKGQGVIIKSTKSGRERMNKLPKFVLDILKKYDAQHEQEKDDSGDAWIKEWNGQQCDFLFTAEGALGRPMRPDSISQWWSRFLKEKGLKHIKFHALRHTDASLLSDEGIPMKDISEHLGHSRESTTANLYTQTFEHSGDRIASTLDHAFNRITNKKE